MKWVKEYNLFFAIDGVERNVVVLHGNQLENALCASSSPRVQPTPYSKLAAAHLIEIIAKISDEEILIVNHNCGVFTTPQGKRTRPGIVEWERVPISVTYCEPFLFIVYTDMISIARVIPYNEV
uniref:CNH domain-containing protein n=1 Tax=Panagrolaimus sp. PS1159 TaxID=55785 RepID=A0AC35GGN2_9BILA